MDDVLILRARRIHTMDAACPQATHVAIEQGRVVAVGDADAVAPWAARAGAVLDDRHAGRVLLPGFVEGHVHTDGGEVWNHTWCGVDARTDPEGHSWTGVSTVEAVVQRLQHGAAARPSAPVVMGWGFDPVHADRALRRADLDRVAGARPVLVMNLSGHIGYVNSEALRRLGWLSAPPRHDGLPLGPDGAPLGELRGVDMLRPAVHALGLGDTFNSAGVEGLHRFARLCVRAGVTTATDLANPLGEGALQALLAATAEPTFPVRLVPALLAFGDTPERLVARAVALRAHATERLSLGRIKLVLDGSIQGFTARLRAGAYADGSPNGLWYMAPETVRALFVQALRHGVQAHVHTNGDQASELALQLLADALAEVPRADHRTVLQHAQLMDEDQLREAARLGAGVNLFANHVWYWGDVHAERTVGPQAAARLDPCGSAERLGVHWSMHSDDPVTPMAPLFTAWCAVNRRTRSGRVLGADERVGVAAALRAVTLGAAWTLGLEHEVGSIVPGKRADFAVLGDDPLGVPPEALKDVPVLGTVLGGRWQPVSRPSPEP